MAEAAPIPFSDDEAFNDLTDKDKTVELSGYICSIKAACSVGEGGKYRLLKFALTNGTKKVNCCIWGQPLIDIHVNDIVMYRRVHIDGAHCKISRISFSMETEGYVPFDLTIQATSTLTYSGMYEPIVEAPVDAQPTPVTFDTIHQTEGKISVDGFIKTNFTAIASRFENASYGCGSITDGTFKITVNITNFVPVDAHQKGVAVRVVGNKDVSKDPISITCRDMTAITLRENIQPMSDAELLRAGKPLKRRAPIG